MSVARTLRNDREKMGEHPIYRPSRGLGPSQQPQPQAAGVGLRPRRGEDPLAELARLIGQEDPFREFDAVQPRRVAAGGNGATHAPVAPARAERPANGSSPHVNGAGQAPRRAAPEAGTTLRQQPLQRNVQPQPARVPAARTDARPATTPAFRPAAAPAAPQARSNGAARGYEDHARPHGRDANDQYAVRPPRTRETHAEALARMTRPAAPVEPRSRRPEPQSDRYAPEETPRHTRGRPQPASYQDDHQRGYENDYDPQYDDDAYLPDHAEDIYDDVQRPRRGWGFWLVAAILFASLIAVAFLGVFAYRTIFNTPPRAAVITKSPVPVKVEPQNTPQTAVSPSNKPIQDRVSGGADPTQVLRREEAPADLTRQPPQAPPVQQKNNPAFAPPLQQQPQAPQQPVPPQQAPQVQQNLIDQQPKRVKTIPLRSDGSFAQPQHNGPLQLQANPEPETPVPPQIRPNSNVPQANRNVASLGPTPAPQQQAAPASGNYVVQVASHKTPDEARSAWEQLKSQYGSLFANRSADIRKVDLGDRGTFYRAMVGPMGRDQANALCQNLKTQGAGCIVQTR